jgi:glutathione S-transferase
VPTLELDDGTVIFQSRDIAYYAARVGNTLPDSDPRKMAHIDEA